MLKKFYMWSLFFVSNCFQLLPVLHLILWLMMIDKLNNPWIDVLQYSSFQVSDSLNTSELWVYLITKTLIYMSQVSLGNSGSWVHLALFRYAFLIQINITFFFLILEILLMKKNELSERNFEKYPRRRHVLSRVTRSQNFVIL